MRAAARPADDVHLVEGPVGEQRLHVGGAIRHGATLEPRGARIARSRVRHEAAAAGERLVDQRRVRNPRRGRAEVEQQAGSTRLAGVPTLE